MGSRERAQLTTREEQASEESAEVARAKRMGAEWAQARETGRREWNGRTKEAGLKMEGRWTTEGWGS
ncbi:hypothetical protein CBR_g23037 [Chara braunii]|uniref:Uncharacterized protein n=1 Tax=Chara braunii TaxID=69332 RepID=A0A388L3J5_CHABU|nr:hypothetical protein CBR_g23037 [Chara braunii]|eukprot:GBG76822.1 hypothetical protein CBR_g23037 [Chara braunii]